jgi:membrane associated rhomboid family serine protease
MSDPGEAPPPERAEGLRLETCYRHPNVATGVHCTRCGRPICTECMRPAAVGYQCPECLREAGHSMPRSRRTLSVGRTGRVTRALIAANVIVFLIEVVIGGPQSLFAGPTARQLLNMGALFPVDVAQGEYWRLFTAMFLHIGILHIAFNMYALYLFGTLVEAEYGSGWFAFIYFFSGLMASVASFVFGPVVAVAAGASGAIFGVFGAWIAFNVRRRDTVMGRANLRGAVGLIVLNFVILFFVSGIDWRAHVGGLLSGFVAGWVAEGLLPRGTSRSSQATVQVGTFVVLGVVAVALTIMRVHAIQALGLPGFG